MITRAWNEDGVYRKGTCLILQDWAARRKVDPPVKDFICLSLGITHR